MEPDRLFECLPSNLRPSTDGESGGGKTHDPHQKSLENAIFTVPTVIPPRVLPLLHDLAQQMVQAGHQQQLFKTYRFTLSSFFFSNTTASNQNFIIETKFFYKKNYAICCF